MLISQCLTFLLQSLGAEPGPLPGSSAPALLLRLRTAAAASGSGSSALIIPSTLICSYTKSCCLKLVNQLSVKPQNVADCGLNLLPWHTIPSAASLLGWRTLGQELPQTFREGSMERNGLEEQSPAPRGE